MQEKETLSEIFTAYQSTYMLGGREITEAQMPDLTAKKQTGSICIEEEKTVNFVFFSR